MTDSAIHHLCSALANRLGLPPVLPRVIGRFSNIAVALDPLPIVARIATGTALLRDTLAFAQREVAIAKYLASRAAPVIAPCDDPASGPYEVNGWTVTLWRRITVLDDLPDPMEASHRLALCHSLLRDYPNTLPYFGAFDELDRALARPHVHQVLARRDRERIDHRARELRNALESYIPNAQTLHGDAHRKNVLPTARGPLWTDWEDTFFAPIEWDLACLVTSARITGVQRDWAEAALSAYGRYDATALDLCIQTRALFGIAWLALLSTEDSGRVERMKVWIDWLHKR